MPVIYIVLVLIVYYYVKRKYKEKKQQEEIEKMKKSIKLNIQFNGIKIDEGFKEKYSKECELPSYEYAGKSQLEKMKESSLNSFLAVASRVEKNIEAGKIAKSNFKISSYFYEDIYQEDLEVRRILIDLEEKKLITLEQLEYLKEKFKLYDAIFWEKDLREKYEEDYKDYKAGFMNKEELEKRRRYYFGDEES